MTPIQFRVLQAKLGISNKEFAKLLKKHVNTINYWRSGYRTITDGAANYIRLAVKEFLELERKEIEVSEIGEQSKEWKVPTGQELLDATKRGIELLKGKQNAK